VNERPGVSGYLLGLLLMCLVGFGLGLLVGALLL